MGMPIGNRTCSCDDYEFSCTGSLTPPRSLVTATTDILQDLENRDVDKYLIDSFHDYIEKRYRVKNCAVYFSNGPVVFRVNVSPGVVLVCVLTYDIVIIQALVVSLSVLIYTTFSLYKLWCCLCLCCYIQHYHCTTLSL